MVVVAGLGVGTAHGQVRSRRELGLLGDEGMQGRGIFAEGWGEGDSRRVAVARVDAVVGLTFRNGGIGEMRKGEGGCRGWRWWCWPGGGGEIGITSHSLFVGWGKISRSAHVGGVLLVTLGLCAAMDLQKNEDR